MDRWTDTSFYKKKTQAEKLNLSEDAMTAKNLITSFASRDDVDYLYVTYHPDQGMIMMTGKNIFVVCDVSLIIVCDICLTFNNLFLSFSLRTYSNF